MPTLETLRRWIGQEVDVAGCDGSRHHGLLLNVTRRSLWLIEDDDDQFVPLADVTELRLAS